jgi:hypothetical protein
MPDNAHHHTLQERLSRLQQQYDLETRVEELMRLEQLMADTRQALSGSLQSRSQPPQTHRLDSRSD